MKVKGRSNKLRISKSEVGIITIQFRIHLKVINPNAVNIIERLWELVATHFLGFPTKIRATEFDKQEAPDMLEQLGLSFSNSGSFCWCPFCNQTQWMIVSLQHATAGKYLNSQLLRISLHHIFSKINMQSFAMNFYSGLCFISASYRLFIHTFSWVTVLFNSVVEPRDKVLLNNLSFILLMICICQKLPISDWQYFVSLKATNPNCERSIIFSAIATFCPINGVYKPCGAIYQFVLD